MQRIPSSAGATVSYDTYGSGPPLVLVHSAFSDHQTNWAFVKPLFEQQFSVITSVHGYFAAGDTNIGVAPSRYSDCF